MKIETTIKYYESYIPPKCRKKRFNEVKETIGTDIYELLLDGTLNIILLVQKAGNDDKRNN